MVNNSYSSFPKKLLYPTDYFPLENPKAQAVYDGFISKLEAHFSMVKEEVNVTATLQQSNVTVVSNQTETANSFMVASQWDSWNEIGKDLATRWNAAYPEAGFPPFDNATRDVYQAAPSLVKGDYDQSIVDKAAFRNHTDKYLLRESSEHCSEGILILNPGTEGYPAYREEYMRFFPGAGALYSANPNPRPWLHPMLLSPMMGAPEISVPIGQVEYESVISHQTEHMPLVIDLVAHAGCDKMLLDFVKALSEKDIIQPVKTGRTAF